MNILSTLAMGQPGQGGNPILNFLPFILIIFIFYFMIIRPQQKKQKERQRLLDSIKKGDKVVTVGGAHGTIVGIEDKTVLVQLADNVKVKYDRTAVAQITREGGEEKSS